MQELAPLTAHILELIVSFAFINNIFGKKLLFEKKATPYFAAAILCTLEYSVYILFDSTAINILLFFFINMTLALMFFNASFTSSVIASAFLSAELTASEFLSLTFLSFGLENDFSYYKESVSVFLLATLISRFIFYIFTKVSEYAGFYLQGNRNIRVPVFLFLYPLTAVAILYTFWIISTSYTITKSTSIAIMIASFAILISVFLTFTFYSRTSKRLDELYKEQSEAERVKTDTAYYAILDKQNEALKMLTHDEKNHLLAIKTIANDPEVSAYIDKIYGEIKVNSVFGNTNNKYLDLLLNKYQTECETNKINFDYYIKTANLSFMDSADMISMISNILDNAVEAAKHSQEKNVNLSINRNGSFDILSCCNSYDQKPTVSEGKLISTKRMPGIHGYGMKSIIKTAEKYGGEVEWNYNENDCLFCVRIGFAGNVDKTTTK